MDFLSAESLPWLEEPRQRLRDALAAGRMPHSLLLLSPPGLGADLFSSWIVALAVCESAASRPCDRCPSCVLLRADNHPDVHVVRLADDKSQISVDQVRELIGTLALTSFRRGRKVGIIKGGESLNAHGSNAFLKTLEEPSGDALLIISARPTHRLPATIASRCLRMTLRPPIRSQGLEWLAQNGGPAGEDWSAALSLAGGAPLLALECRDSGVARLDAEMREAMRALGAGTVDVTLVAEQWAKGNLGLRLAWLENWITWRVHTWGEGPHPTQTAERIRLPGALLKPKIRSLFELLDGARELRRLASTGINQQLALEALLLGGRSAFSA